MADELGLENTLGATLHEVLSATFYSIQFSSYSYTTITGQSKEVVLRGSCTDYTTCIKQRKTSSLLLNS